MLDVGCWMLDVSPASKAGQPCSAPATAVQTLARWSPPLSRPRTRPDHSALDKRSTFEIVSPHEKGQVGASLRARRLGHAKPAARRRLTRPTHSPQPQTKSKDTSTQGNTYLSCLFNPSGAKPT